jgi:Flp pilus assembly protein TadD
MREIHGMALRGLGRKKEALLLLQRAAERLPRDTNVLNNYGVLLAEAEDVERALEVWHRVLEIDPTNAMARANLEARGAAPDGSRRKE